MYLGLASANSNKVKVFESWQGSLKKSDYGAPSLNSHVAAERAKTHGASYKNYFLLLYNIVQGQVLDSALGPLETLESRIWRKKLFSTFLMHRISNVLGSMQGSPLPWLPDTNLLFLR